MKIGIVLGSVREGRLGEGVAKWVATEAQKRTDSEMVLLDVASYRLPLLDAAVIPGMANREYPHESVKAWSRDVDACDAYVFVTPEYNHSVPGPMKNAIDWLMPEWWGKSVAFVSYGASSGVRAVDHWRQILANFSMMDIRDEVNFSIFTDFPEGTFTPRENSPESLSTMLDSLVAAAKRNTDRM